MPRNYILVIAQLSNRILSLPKSSLKHMTTVRSRKRFSSQQQSQESTDVNSNEDGFSEEDDDENDEEKEEEDDETANDTVRDQTTTTTIYSQRKNSPTSNQSKNELRPESGSTSSSQSVSELEQRCLLESIEFLNGAQRVQFIVQSLDNYLQDEQLLNALCEICHNLMIYNRMAILEYK